MFDRPLFADDMGIPMDIDAEAKVMLFGSWSWFQVVFQGDIPIWLIIFHQFYKKDNFCDLFAFFVHKLLQERGLS